MQTGSLHHEGHTIGQSRENANLEAQGESNSNSDGHGVNGQMAPTCNKMEQQSMVEAPADPQRGLNDADYATMLLNTFAIPVKQIATVSTHAGHHPSID
jgi:hypothetical protein